ncbi:MAG TPA: hypothetical protein VH120_07910, partial [Gemmataceae bacterium]|nr:hypothetical protein [Gemmataceae bacterium]
RNSPPSTSQRSDDMSFFLEMNPGSTDNLIVSASRRVYPAATADMKDHRVKPGGSPPPTLGG